MMEEGPSIEEWKELYDVALEFKRVGSWNWMWDDEMFGIENPETGEIGYCSVMGRAGEHFALAVYLGAEGLEGLIKVQEDESPLPNMDNFYLQKCLMASLEDRRFLQKKDLEIIRTLGLKFRGRNSWPLFRSYRPGYHPWFLTSEEARYLTQALREAIGVCLRFKEDPGILSPPKEGHYLVRVPTKVEGGLEWRDEYVEPERSEKTELTPVTLDEDRLEAIRSAALPRRGLWEIDVFRSPFRVGERDERPRYPHTAFFVEHRSGVILDHMLVESEDHRPELVDHFMTLIEDTRLLPGGILVKRDEVFELVEPISLKLDIELVKVEELSATDEAREGMFDFFLRSPR